MKIVALTTTAPGLRYSAHLQTLQALGIELVSISFAGWGCFVDKAWRHWRIIKRRGLVDYLNWRASNRAASFYRQEVSNYLEDGLSGEVCPQAKPSIIKEFSGFSREALRFIEEQKPDFLFQLGAGLLPPHFVRNAPPILNLHPGILPGIRGLDPLFWAHYYGREDWIGTTLHYIDEGIDTGPPILRRRFKPLKGAHYAESVKKQLCVEIELLQLFFGHYPLGYQSFDMGGCPSSIYRSHWSKKQYEELRACNWWGAARLG